MLCTSQGYPVLDQNNNRIILPNTVGEQDLTVDSEGNLFIPGGQNGQKIPVTVTVNGQTYNQAIGLVQFNNPAGLNSIGNNLYQPTPASGAPLEEDDNQGLQRSLVRQGHLEMSNVQVADEMVNMIVAQRAYEMNSKAIQASDEMLQQANNLRG